jgi:hypothetical protein
MGACMPASWYGCVHSCSRRKCDRRGCQSWHPWSITPTSTCAVFVHVTRTQKEKPSLSCYWKARSFSWLILRLRLLSNGEGGFECDEEFCFTGCYTGMACESLVFSDLQLQRVRATSLEDFNSGGAHRVRVLSFRVKTQCMTFIDCISQWFCWRYCFKTSNFL